MGSQQVVFVKLSLVGEYESLSYGTILVGESSALELSDLD